MTATDAVGYLDCHDPAQPPTEQGAAPVTIELLEEMWTASKRFRIAPDQAAELKADAEEVTVTWQLSSGHAPTVLVTAPAGTDGWAIPVPHRPSWLLTLIVNNAPSWWLQ
ncbi:hypothetical protein [Streptomyces werraensis]|uniref:hypothetical protein n=1 Tax=Streptomyces werraensis TaxID=68284 RepID=UPI0037D7FF59